ncbi:MAG TPA: hypothetical protein VER32_15285 [Pyrinomonadaceae bacterium]|nr:hypothetical protein [Pyrinomonadaceae bacterium]
MSTRRKTAFVCALLAAALFAGCQPAGDGSNTATRNANANASGANTSAANTAATPATTTTTGADGVIGSGSGVEKEKPAAGKANVQGKVLFIEQPASGVEVKLCETFSRFIGGCGGETFTTKTDAAGEYLFKDVTPRVYEGLIVKVFNSNYYVFATSGIVQTAKYNVESDKTFFAPDTQLFKNDLKLVNPKAGAKVAAEGLEVKWDAYPDAAYYKMSIFADTASGAETNYDYINKRVDGTSFVLDKPLAPGTYNVKVESYNSNDTKLAQNSDDIKFTVPGAAGGAAK